MHGTTWYVVVSVRHCPVVTDEEMPEAVLGLLELLVLELGAEELEEDGGLVELAELVDEGVEVALCTVGPSPPPPQAASVTAAAATPTI